MSAENNGKAFSHFLHWWNWSPDLIILERMSVRGELLPSQYLCTFVIIRFFTSYLLNEGLGVTQFMGCYSLLHLPKITRVHNPLLCPIPVQQVGEKIEASRETALLLVPQMHSEQEHCWPDVQKVENSLQRSH